jgi:hypothetical protein
MCFSGQIILFIEDPVAQTKACVLKKLNCSGDRNTARIEKPFDEISGLSCCSLII